MDPSPLLTSAFDFALPPDLIAQYPAATRDGSRLLVFNRSNGSLAHHSFVDFPNFLRAGDVLVVNDSRVIPARIRARHSTLGTAFELLLLEEMGINDWWAMIRPGKRAPVGQRLTLLQSKCGGPEITGEVMEINSHGHRRLRFTGINNIGSHLETLGEVPLPPYIQRSSAASNKSETGDATSAPLPQPSAIGNADRQRAAMSRDPDRDRDRDRYQTVYARADGSVAAPTAGLHFTPGLLDFVRAAGVQVCSLTLHVGPGTFAPVKSESLTDHLMHEERYELPFETVTAIQAAKRAGGRIIAVGTTTLRVLETIAASHHGALQPGSGRSSLFIYPPYSFQIVDGLLTNFHLPRSTLLMLVSAFAAPGETRGREQVLSAYAAAIAERYRFYSYGDAMLLQ